MVSLNVTIKTIDESNLEDEVLLCVPSQKSPKYSTWKFDNGVKDKAEWLRRKLKEYGYLGHIAYGSNAKPLGFVEFNFSEGRGLTRRRGGDNGHNHVHRCV